MTELHALEPNDPPADKAIQDAHDLKYGWHKSCPKVYTNLARNREYQTAVPEAWLEQCKDHHQVHQRLWDWHNRKPIISLFEGEFQSQDQPANLLYEKQYGK